MPRSKLFVTNRINYCVLKFDSGTIKVGFSLSGGYTMKISMKRLGWIGLAILGCKVAVNAHEPKSVIKPYKNTIVGIIQEPVLDGYIISFAFEKKPVICNQLLNSYEESLDLQSATYFLPLTHCKSSYLKDKLMHISDTLEHEGFCMRIRFEQKPIEGILVAVTLDSGYTIEKVIHSNARQVSFIIKK